MKVIKTLLLLKMNYIPTSFMFLSFVLMQLMKSFCKAVEIYYSG